MFNDAVPVAVDEEETVPERYVTLKEEAEQRWQRLIQRLHGGLVSGPRSGNPLFDSDNGVDERGM